MLAWVANPTGKFGRENEARAEAEQAQAKVLFEQQAAELRLQASAEKEAAAAQILLEQMAVEGAQKAAAAGYTTKNARPRSTSTGQYTLGAVAVSGPYLFFTDLPAFIRCCI